MNIGGLLNPVGLSTGLVLYALLLVMVIRAGRAPGVRPGLDPLLLGTSVLGLIWNLSALIVDALPKLGVEGPFPFLTAVGFGGLGFLPAVVVHSVLRGDRQGVRGALKQCLATVAYTASAVALALDLRSAWTGGPVPASAAMRLLTYTFVALIVPLAGVTRRQPGARRALWAAALATFAVSALHLSGLHQGESAWPIELVGHHASLPLALAILYQDYPFAFADLFLKRALSALVVVGLVIGAVAAFASQSIVFAQFVQRPKQVGVLVSVWVGTVLVFPRLRGLILRFIDTVVLHRPDYASLRATIARDAQAHHDVSALLSDLCTQLAPAVSARSVTWREWQRPDDGEPFGSSVATGSKALALARSAVPNASDRATPSDTAALVVTVPTSEAPRYVLVFAQLTGGRRFFSDDFAALENIAVIAARRIDAIRLATERYDRELREREIGKLAAEAELRALRAQINPHFLFNAMTTIGHLIQSAPPRALQTLMRLTALLRAGFRSEGEFTTLGRELEVVEAYLDIERARFEERLQVEIDVPANLRNLRVPPLVLQPLVENAVRHGIASRQAGGAVVIRARIDRERSGVPRLSLLVKDTGAGSTPSAVAYGRKNGIGLRNVERRLECLYGREGVLLFRTSIDEGATVELRIPIEAKATSEEGRRRVAL